MLDEQGRTQYKRLRNEVQKRCRKSQTILNKIILSACPKFCRSFAAIRSTPGALFAFRPLNAFSNSSLKIEFTLSSFCTSFSFSMRSVTTSPFYRLSIYSTHLLTLSMLFVNAFSLSYLTMFCINSSFPKIFADFPVSCIYFFYFE